MRVSALKNLKNFFLINMAYKIIIKPLVFSDVEDAFNWYNKQVVGLGDRYYNQFWITINIIKSQPFVFSYLKPPIRRCRMKIFPYKFII